MRKFICLLLIILNAGTLLLAQNDQFLNVVEYKISNFESLTKEYKGILEFDDKKMTFSLFPVFNANENVRIHKDADNYKVNLKYQLNRLDTVYYKGNIDSDTIFFNKLHPLEINKRVTVHRDKKIIDWVISDSIKTIDGYRCRQAMGEYKNIKYEVWFAEDVPVPFGPLIFNNLPGLVLEVRNSSNTYFINAVRISKQHRFFTKLPCSKSVITYNEYLNLVKESVSINSKEIKHKIQRLKSRFERN